jgi:hypothetical protein
MFHIPLQVYTRTWYWTPELLLPWNTGHRKERLTLNSINLVYIIPPSAHLGQSQTREAAVWHFQG